MKYMLIGCVLLVSVFASAFAQEAGPPPLAISEKPTNAQGDLMFEAQNTSKQAIRGFVVVSRSRNSAGEPRGKIVQVQIRGVVPPDEPNSIAPGEAISMTVHPHASDSSGNMLLYTASLDYVLFSDGAEWGPDTEKQSLEVRGVLEGSRQAILGLKELLATQGSDAIVAYLKGYDDSK